MDSALIGGSLGVVGVLAGAVLALWWKAKATQARGQAQLLASKLADEEERHEETLVRCMRQADMFEQAKDVKDEVIRDLRIRNQQLRERSLENASHHDLLDLANRPPSMRLVHSNKVRHEVANENSDGA